MQSLAVISLNLWQILISLCNLLILYLILKKFLFQRVKKVMAQRQEDLDKQYQQAARAEEDALANQKKWEQTMSGAKQQADEMLRSAAARAERRSDQIVAEAKERADGIVRQAESEAQLERRKAADEMKHELVDLSTQLAEKMLQREIRQQDHHDIIQAFVDQIGENDDRDQ